MDCLVSGSTELMQQQVVEHFRSDCWNQLKRHPKVTYQGLEHCMPAIIKVISIILSSRYSANLMQIKLTVWNASNRPKVTKYRKAIFLSRDYLSCGKKKIQLMSFVELRRLLYSAESHIYLVCIWCCANTAISVIREKMCTTIWCWHVLINRRNWISWALTHES